MIHIGDISHLRPGFREESLRKTSAVMYKDILDLIIFDQCSVGRRGFNQILIYLVRSPDSCKVALRFVLQRIAVQATAQGNDGHFAVGEWNQKWRV